MRPSTFFVFAAGAFGLGSTYLGSVLPIQGTVVASALVCAVGLVVFTLGRSEGTTFGLMGAVVPIAVALGLVNVAVSERPLLSLTKVFGWLAIVVIARDLARHSTPHEVDRIRRWMPWILGGVAGLLLLQGAEDPEVLGARRHLAATYLGLAMSAGLFSQLLLWRLFWIGVGVIGIYISASRGALLTLPISVAGYGTYSILSRRTKDAVAMLVLAGVVGVVFLIPSLRYEFFAMKTRGYGGGYESLEAGMEQRLFLTEETWKIAVAHPLGTGAGPTYGVTYGTKRLGAHNGYLDTLVQLGFASTILLFGWYAFLVLKALGNRNLAFRDKGLFMTYVVVLHVRAFGESYSVFDAASLYVLLLWYMTFYGAYEARGTVAQGLSSRDRSRLGSAQRFRVGPAMPLVRGGGHLQPTRAGMEHTGQASRGSASRSAGDRA